MTIEPIEFALKDGRRAVIRCPREEDVQGMLDYLRVSAGETEFILRYPEECDRYTPEGEKAVFERKNAAENEAMLLCLAEGEIAGVCGISWSTFSKLRHRANVEIALLRDYWNLGIGTRMLERLIRLAEEDGQILQLELDYIEGNTRARALYEKLGFRIAGVKPNAIRLRDGSFRNEISMIREIRR